MVSVPTNLPFFVGSLAALIIDGFNILAILVIEALCIDGKSISVLGEHQPHPVIDIFGALNEDGIFDGVRHGARRGAPCKGQCQKWSQSSQVHPGGPRAALPARTHT